MTVAAVLPASQWQEPCNGVVVALGCCEHVAVQVSESIVPPWDFGGAKRIAHVYIHTLQGGLHTKCKVTNAPTKLLKSACAAITWPASYRADCSWVRLTFSEITDLEMMS